MIIVVADSSPLIGLVKIGQVGILPLLYRTVAIPTEVPAELASPRRPPEVQAFMAARPSWLIVQSPAILENIVDLDPGENAAINLARELSADLLLIDETNGRQAAISRGIRTARLAAVLFDAANAGILADLGSAFASLRTTNFRVPAAVLDQLLAEHQRLKSDQPAQ